MLRCLPTDRRSRSASQADHRRQERDRRARPPAPCHHQCPRPWCDWSHQRGIFSSTADRLAQCDPTVLAEPARGRRRAAVAKATSRRLDSATFYLCQLLLLRRTFGVQRTSLARPTATLVTRIASCRWRLTVHRRFTIDAEHSMPSRTRRARAISMKATTRG